MKIGVCDQTDEDRACGGRHSTSMIIIPAVDLPTIFFQFELHGYKVIAVQAPDNIHLSINSAAPFSFMQPFWEKYGFITSKDTVASVRSFQL